MALSIRRQSGLYNPTLTELNILLYNKTDNTFNVAVFDIKNQSLISIEENYKCEYNSENVEKNPLIDAISTPLITPDIICFPTVGGYIYEIQRANDSIKQVASAESVFEAIKGEEDYLYFGWIRVLGYSNDYYLVSINLMIDKTVPEAAVGFFVVFDSNWNMITYTADN